VLSEVTTALGKFGGRTLQFLEGEIIAASVACLKCRNRQYRCVGLSKILFSKNAETYF